MAEPLVTGEDVRNYLRLQDSADAEWLQDAADAATDYVNSLSHVDATVWDYRTRTGADPNTGCINTLPRLSSTVTNCY